MSSVSGESRTANARPYGAKVSKEREAETVEVRRSGKSMAGILIKVNADGREAVSADSERKKGAH